MRFRALLLGKSGGVLCTGHCTDFREEGETCNQDDNCVGDLSCTCGVCRQDETAKCPMNRKSDSQCASGLFCFGKSAVSFALVTAQTFEKKAKHAIKTTTASAISPALVAFAGKMETTKCPMKGLASQITSALPDSFASANPAVSFALVIAQTFEKKAKHAIKTKTASVI